MPEGEQNYVATVVRDDFFNDPFFKVTQPYCAVLWAVVFYCEHIYQPLYVAMFNKANLSS